MRIIASYTQTYNSGGKWSPGSDGVDREFLFDALLKDKNKIKCLNNADITTFTFHDLPIEKSKKIANKIKPVLPKAEFLVYQNMSFSATILKHITFLKEKGATDFMWIQDDEFFTYKNFKGFEKIIQAYRNTPKIKNLNLLYSFNNNILTSEYSEHKNISFIDKIDVSKDLCIYETNTSLISPSQAYEMDFTAFICDIDYFLSKIFTSNSFNILNAYELEASLKNNAVKNNAQRCFTNVSFFESFNIAGLPPSLGNKPKASSKLVELYG